ncbi:MAG: hypothetical protein V7K53_32170 [Nostoc sp.]|uniref:hypothetical protein n=1 Tax=Nostoc sp. TaxID=1180 RepID=UPI002FFCC35B
MRILLIYSPECDLLNSGDCKLKQRSLYLLNLLDISASVLRAIFGQILGAIANCSQNWGLYSQPRLRDIKPIPITHIPNSVALVLGSGTFCGVWKEPLKKA